MGLRVNNNIAALNAYRNLSVTDGQMSKSLEKLSSGFRINRAADDAAGLAISEGLRSQIGGLKVAVRNTQDGISVVQTAEGALTETHSILQRMRDLSVQASNSGGLNDDAKKNVQSEIVQLKSELDRIADTTTFNGKKLLDGSFKESFQVGANAGETIAVNVGTAMGSAGLKVDGVDVTGAGDYTFDASGAAAAGEVADLHGRRRQHRCGADRHGRRRRGLDRHGYEGRLRGAHRHGGLRWQVLRPGLGVSTTTPRTPTAAAPPTVRTC